MEEYVELSRRRFIRVAMSGGLAACLAPTMLMSREEDTRITILHTNDTHSRIDPFPANDPKYAGMGGVARRSGMIEKIRSTTEHVLLLDSGDFFQGTPYFNLFGGSVEIAA
ncbi:MAG: bifunctional metallophosphatase/5'-nucleotidase, partial [Bacteroidota bacterium]